MNTIQYIKIAKEDNLKNWTSQLNLFFDSLDTEKEFFSNLGMEYINDSNFIIIAKEDGKIVGIAGVKTSYLIIHKAYIVVEKGHQGGLGTILSMKRNEESQRLYNSILLKIHLNNIASQKMNRNLGCKVVGKRFSEDYFIMPFNVWGLCMFYLLRAIMPSVHCIDRIFLKFKK